MLSSTRRPLRWGHCAADGDHSDSTAALRSAAATTAKAAGVVVLVSERCGGGAHERRVFRAIAPDADAPSAKR